MKARTSKATVTTKPKPSGEPQSTGRRRTYIVAAALAGFAVLCFANSLVNGFVFDDRIHLLERPLLRSLSNLPKLLSDSYRPLRNVSYAIDYELWGERAFGFHLTNILIHAANSVLVFFLARRITRELIWASIATLVFVAHPMQPDSVTYISGRRDLLFSLFYLASFHFYLGYHGYVERRDEKGYRRGRALALYLAFFGCWILSLLSKEMAASLPLFLFAWSFCEAWSESQPSWLRRLWDALRTAFKRDRWLYCALLLAAPVYGWYTIFVTGASLRARFGFNYWGDSFVPNMLTALRVHAWYLKQLVYPTPVVQYYGAFDVSTSLADWRVIAAIVVVAAVLAGGFALLNRDRRLAFAILSYFVLLLPVSQIIPHHELLADHYLYLPLVSFGIFVGVLLDRLSAGNLKVRRIAVSTGAALVAALAVTTFLRNTVYKNDLTLWEANYKEAPTSTRAVFNLASQYSKSFPAKAGELYEKCIEMDPGYSPAYTQLASLYQTREKARRVEELVERGLALPDSAVVRPGREHVLKFRSDLTTALALAKASQGDQRAGEELMLKAIELWPASPEPYELLARYYRNIDRNKEFEILKKEIAASPQRALQLLSFRLIEDKKHDEALPYLNQILEIAPNDFYANYQLGQIARTKNDCPTARSHLTRARAAAVRAEDLTTVEDALKKLNQQCR